MPDRETVTGRVRDADGAPHRGLVVTGHGRGVHGEDVVLAEGVTAADGTFALPVPRDALAAGDVTLDVRDAHGVRDLATARVPVGGRVPDVVLAAGDVDGWAVTAGHATPPRLTRGNEVALVFDGEDAFRHVLDAVEAAEREVTLCQLWLETDFTAAFPDATAPPVERPHGRRLLDALLAANRRGVRVRVLLNENVVIPDSVDDVRAVLRDAGDHDVRVRAFPMRVNTMHTKILVADADTYLVGSPFQQRFWDTRAHHAHDARRGPDEPPLHDMLLRVRGPAADELAGILEDLWAARDDAVVEEKSLARTAQESVAGVWVRARNALDLPRRRAPRAAALAPEGPPLPPQPSPFRDQSVQVVLTTPPDILERAPRGEQSIVEALTRAIANARRLVYLETQYFTNATLARTLSRALARHPGLEVILVVNEHMDIPSYDAWQDARLREMGHPGRERLGVFTLWSPGLTQDGRRGIRPVYNHSGLGVVDDVWLTFGNANLDGISLDGAVEIGHPHKLNVDVNAILLDGVDGHPATGVARTVRRNAWAEHLGLREDAVPDTPALAAWRDAAARNEAAAREGRPLRGHVLPLHPDVPDALKLPGR